MFLCCASDYRVGDVSRMLGVLVHCAASPTFGVHSQCWGSDGACVCIIDWGRGQRVVFIASTATTRTFEGATAERICGHQKVAKAIHSACERVVGA